MLEFSKVNLVKIRTNAVGTLGVARVGEGSRVFGARVTEVRL